MDFFTVPTAKFRLLHLFLVIRNGRRDVLRCAVTTSPTAGWVAQQFREAFPFESAPRFMIFDRDAIFSAGPTATIRSMLTEPTRTSYQSPWQNGFAERLVGTVRRELLDHVIVLNERHVRQLIESFVTYYNVRQDAHRGRQGLAVRAPGRAEARRDVQCRQHPSGRRLAPPLRLAPGSVDGRGPEAHLDRAASSAGGR
jgi:hypothetical protein